MNITRLIAEIGIDTVFSPIPIVGPAIKIVVQDYATRQLSQLEEKRIGESAQYCIQKIQSKINKGEILRTDDRFFANNENYRSDASEIFEGVLTKCKNEHEEKKQMYISNIFVNVAFSTVSLGDANHLLKLAGSMTFRQICLLKLINDNSKKNLGLRESKKETYTSQQVSILQEIYEMTQMGLVMKETDDEEKGITWEEPGNYNDPMYGWNEVIPGKMKITPFGETFYKILNLDEIPDLEVEEYKRDLC